ncbi:MAG: hypothetical protein ABIJ09_16770 [Pseudomonadota bacterium]
MSMRHLLVVTGIVVTASCAPASGSWSPRLICHNSNCVEPPRPEEDDTVESLEASLALRSDDGTPLLDGVEIDTFWFGAESRCLFAHDLENASRLPARTAAEMVRDHLRDLRREARPLSRSRGPFVLFVELKGHVGPAKSELHDEGQRTAHADCALEILDTLAGPAQQEGLPVEITFTSFVPVLLSEVQSRLAARGWQDSDNVVVRTGAILGLPTPLDSQNHTLEEFDASTGISMVTAHPHWISLGQRQAFASRGLALGYWMFSAVPETYAALERDQPRYVTTNEAHALWRWLAQRELP